MREILFRGQTRKYGEKVRMNGEKLPGNWVYGGIFPGTGAYSVIYGWEQEDEQTGANLKKLTVYSDTVGQHIDRTDKNGVKVFEGDILRVCLNPEICIGTVEYDERVCGFIVKFSDNKCVTFMDVHIGESKAEGWVWIEVIGNIYDNPELLNEGQ